MMVVSTAAAAAAEGARTVCTGMPTCSTDGTCPCVGTATGCPCTLADASCVDACTGAICSVTTCDCLDVCTGTQCTEASTSGCYAPCDGTPCGRFSEPTQIPYRECDEMGENADGIRCDTDEGISLCTCDEVCTGTCSDATGEMGCVCDDDVDETPLSSSSEEDVDDDEEVRGIDGETMEDYLVEPEIDGWTDRITDPDPIDVEDEDDLEPPSDISLDDEEEDEEAPSVGEEEEEEEEEEVYGDIPAYRDDGEEEPVEDLHPYGFGDTVTIFDPEAPQDATEEEAAEDVYSPYSEDEDEEDAVVPLSEQEDEEDGNNNYCSVDSDCDDADACTVEMCNPVSGECTWGTLACDDHNPCTEDVCDPIHGCSHGTDECDDHDPCTEDRCHPILGCSHVSTGCDDGDDCTVDSCSVEEETGQIVCLHEAMPCDDGVECTVDTCISGICVYDSSPCLGCSADSDCRDGDACTTDRCDTFAGRCVHETFPWGCECHDSGDCAAEEDWKTCRCAYCDRGKCRTVHSCDDRDASTTDACLPVDGECVHTPKNKTKTVGLPSVDWCRRQLDTMATWRDDLGSDYAAWVHGANLGFEPDRVDGMPATSTPFTCSELRDFADALLFVPAPKDGREVLSTGVLCDGLCSDGDMCTVDSCSTIAGEGCVHFAMDCDDGNLCTEDRCVAGECLHTSRNCSSTGSGPCETGWCFPADGECYSRHDERCDCDDDGCSRRVWVQGINAWTDIKIDCDDGDSCTTDSCVPPIGACSHRRLDCDDGNSTTYDGCLDGECVHLETGCPAPDRCHTARRSGTRCIVEVLSCDDGDSCTVDSCDPRSGCRHSNKTCTPTDACTLAACDPKSGMCVEIGRECDDHDECTTDSCDPVRGCRHVSRVCDDGLACTNDQCNPATGGCAYVARDCDDHDACTLDYCHETEGCVHVPTVDAGNQTAGTCGLERCCHVTGALSTINVDCDDGDLCTEDGCDGSGGCINTPPVFVDDSLPTREGSNSSPRVASCMSFACNGTARFWEPLPVGTVCGSARGNETQCDGDGHCSGDDSHHHHHSDDSTTTIIIVMSLTIGLTVIGIVLIVVLTVVIRRRRRNRVPKTTTGQSATSDNYTELTNSEFLEVRYGSATHRKW